MHHNADLPAPGGRRTVRAFIVHHGRPGSAKRKCSEMLDISKWKCLLPHACGGKGHMIIHWERDGNFIRYDLGQDDSGLKTNNLPLPPGSRYVTNL